MSDLKIKYHGWTFSASWFELITCKKQWIFETISGSIDVTRLPIGIHEVELILDLDENKYAYEPIKVTVFIKEKTAEESENE